LVLQSILTKEQNQYQINRYQLGENMMWIVFSEKQLLEKHCWVDVLLDWALWTQSFLTVLSMA